MSKTISGATTQFLYDGFNPVQELAPSTPPLPPVPTANMLTELGIDEYFQRSDTVNGTLTLMTDALGSPLALTNSSMKAAVTGKCSEHLQFKKQKLSQQMLRTTTKTLVVRRVVQLFLTEALSIWLFFPGHGLGEGFSLRTGLLAPITLAFFPLWAFEERSYGILSLTLLVNMAFVSIIGFSIIKRIKWISGICLLLFNVVGIMLVLNGM